MPIKCSLKNNKSGQFGVNWRILRDGTSSWEFLLVCCFAILPPSVFNIAVRIVSIHCWTLTRSLETAIRISGWEYQRSSQCLQKQMSASAQRWLYFCVTLCIKNFHHNNTIIMDWQSNQIVSYWLTDWQTHWWVTDRDRCVFNLTEFVSQTVFKQPHSHSVAPAIPCSNTRANTRTFFHSLACPTGLSTIYTKKNTRCWN